ncbi:MAG: hypothetical protein NXI32_15795 [bacterium]|nr:hypothetical protein [bacterium]
MPQATPPSVELHELVSLFYADHHQLGKFLRQEASTLPPAYKRMLAHEAHMTVTVEKRHGCAVDVQVLASHQTDTHYIRKILLRRSSDQRVVQFGIVRLALSALQEAVRDEILAQQIPLGRVLIEHQVLRHVHLDGLWHVQCGAELADYFAVQTGHKTYGRTALIYCNGEPGVELLEVVAPEDTFAPAAHG